jgi:hypothetical protein
MTTMTLTGESTSAPAYLLMAFEATSSAIDRRRVAER